MAVHRSAIKPSRSNFLSISYHFSNYDGLNMLLLRLYFSHKTRATLLPTFHCDAICQRLQSARNRIDKKPLLAPACDYLELDHTVLPLSGLSKPRCTSVLNVPPHVDIWIL